MTLELCVFGGLVVFGLGVWAGVWCVTKLEEWQQELDAIEQANDGKGIRHPEL